MFLKSFIAFFALISCLSPLSAATTTSGTPPQINVLIVHDKVGVVVEVKGRYKIYDPNTGKHLTTRFTGKRKFIQPMRDGLKWGEEFPGTYQLLIAPDEATTTVVVDGTEYRGLIYVYDIGGTVSVVNRVSIEDYLAQTLSQRYKQEQSPEVLAALAITARTSAYYRIAYPKNQYWAVDATQVGYQGIPAINFSSPIVKAINATRYMVMNRTSEGKAVSFLAEWPEGDSTQGSSPQAVLPEITSSQADEMAQKGAHAAQILAKAFPGIRIDLIHYSNE